MNELIKLQAVKAELQFTNYGKSLMKFQVTLKLSKWVTSNVVNHSELFISSNFPLDLFVYSGRLLDNIISEGV